MGSSSETEFSKQRRETELFSGFSLRRALLAHTTNPNGLSGAASSGPAAPERCRGRLEHRTSTAGGRDGGDSTSGALPGPEEPEALGHVQSSEAHGQLSTTPDVPRATTRSSSTPSCRFMSMPRSSYGSMMPGQQVPLER